jgi:hypothetical protein
MEAILITQSKGYNLKGKKRKRKGSVIVDCSNWAVEFEKYEHGKANEIQVRTATG